MQAHNEGSLPPPEASEADLVLMSGFVRSPQSGPAWLEGIATRRLVRCFSSPSNPSSDLFTGSVLM